MARSTYFDLGRSADACPGSESGYAQRFQCGNIVKRRIWTRMPDYRVEDEKTGLSELEAHILTSIDHVWLVRISLVSRCCERDAELWLKGTRGKCALSNHRPHSEGGFGPDQFGRNIPMGLSTRCPRVRVPKFVIWVLVGCAVAILSAMAWTWRGKKP